MTRVLLPEGPPSSPAHWAKRHTAVRAIALDGPWIYGDHLRDAPGPQERADFQNADQRADPRTAAVCQFTSEIWTPDRRHHTIPWEWHALTATIPLDAADHLLLQARAENWRTSTLKQAVRRWRSDYRKDAG